MSFRGILGLWSYPIINMLLSVLSSKTTQQLRPGTTSNIEVWEWTDSTGRERRLEVHRKVEEYE